MSKGKHTLYAHDLQMLKNLIMQCPTVKYTTLCPGDNIILSPTDYKALWELKQLVEEILEDVEE